MKYALQKEQKEALQSVTPELINAAKSSELFSRVMADCYGLIDEKEAAIDWIENAVQRGSINYPYFSQYNPFLKTIRGEERFKQLMHKVKQKWEQFEI